MDERIWFDSEELHGTFTKEWKRLGGAGGTGTLQGEVLRAARRLCEAWFGRGERDGAGTEAAWELLRNATLLRPTSGRLMVIGMLADWTAKNGDAEAYGRGLRLLAGNAALYAECRPLVRTKATAGE